ncbi:Gp37-like protein [Streptomyces decoyicus]
MAYRIEVRDRNLRRIGEIDTWTKLDVVVEFNDVGSWQLLIKAGTPQANLLDKGGGICLWQDGVPQPIFTGQIENFQTYWTVEQHTGRGSIYVGGKCDNKLAIERLAFPDPSKPVSQQYRAPESRTVKRPAGEAIWSELNSSVGPGALADRRVSGVDIGTVPVGLGGIINDTLRYDSIGPKLNEWCTAQNLGYRFVYNPDTSLIELDIYQPTDKSREVRFSPDLGNLREYVWNLTCPKVTRVIVACQGEGSGRYIYQKADSASEAEWGMQIETFVDRRDVPLQTGPDGSPVLVATADSDGIEDIGTNPENGGEWTTALTTARTNYINALAAVQAAEAAVAAAVTPAEKTAANTQLASANANKAQTLTDLKAAIVAAKPTAVAYWLTVIEAAADAALAEGASNGNFQIYPIDTPQCMFGRDYFVGDKVTVAIDGVEYVDVVRKVTISVDDGGKVSSATSVIGEQGTGEPLNLYKTVFELREKLRKLERRK